MNTMTGRATLAVAAIVTAPVCFADQWFYDLQTAGEDLIFVTPTGVDPLNSEYSGGHEITLVEVDVTVRVEEGTPYETIEIEIDPKIRAALGPEAPSPPQARLHFKPREIQAYALALAQYLRRRGHADPEVLTTATPDNAALPLGPFGGFAADGVG